MSIIQPNIKISGEYVNGHTNIQCICKVCGHKWQSKPYSLLQKHGCPRCAKSGTSFMEQFIKSSFELALGKEYVLSRNKSTIGMELDIYIPSLKIAIEPGNWYLHKRFLERDRSKREKCKSNGIRLITIYDKYPLSQSAPFENDCFVFNDDLNKVDHCVIDSIEQSHMLEYAHAEKLIHCLRSICSEVEDCEFFEKNVTIFSNVTSGLFLSIKPFSS